MKIAATNIGIIKGCKAHSPHCEYKCCNFTDNYIVLYPNEYENSKLNKDHLKIIDDNYLGGKKAVCSRHCKEGDLKPLDCKCYPYFPKINKEGELKILKGKKCPLSENELSEHKEKFSKIWKELIKEPAIFTWVKNTKLVGYK